MLAQLFIRNIAVIEKASIDLEKGFTVLTGETGAGKSIIIDAIHAVLGERTSKELVRTGTDSASVSALFTGLDEDTLSLLDRLSLPREEDGSLLIQRDIRLEGRSTCKINGAPATVSMLKQLGPRLVTIHGQHESYELLSPEVHMEYLDSFAGLESLLAEYQAAYRTLRETQRQLEALQTDEGEKARLSDLLHYQIDEIEAANVRVGEREELEAQRELIRNSEKIASALELLRPLPRRGAWPPTCRSWRRPPKNSRRQGTSWRTWTPSSTAPRWTLTPPSRNPLRSDWICSTSWA